MGAPVSPRAARARAVAGRPDALRPRILALAAAVLVAASGCSSSYDCRIGH
jgi:hypothetical protein